MPSPQNDSDPSGRGAEEDLAQPQDTFRKVYFGQIADPLIPEPQQPAGTPEDELTRAALSDPDALTDEWTDRGPTSWRWVFLLLLAVAALGIVFWKR